LSTALSIQCDLCGDPVKPPAPLLTVDLAITRVPHALSPLEARTVESKGVECCSPGCAFRAFQAALDDALRAVRFGVARDAVGARRA